MIGPDRPRAAPRRRSVVLVAASLAWLAASSVAAPPPDALSLRFDRVPVADLLPLIAGHYGLDLVVLGEPAGSVSVDLEGRTLGEVLDEILFGTGYTHQVTARSLRIVPEATVVSRTFTLDHLDAAEIAEEAANIFKEADVAVSAATNSITVVGSALDVRHFEEMLAVADVRPRQVDIRSRMIEVKLSDLQTLGIDWLFQWDDQFQDVDASTAVIDPAIPTLRLAYSRLTSFQADAILEALLTETDSKIISAPRIASTNNQTSKVLVGERVPYTRLTVETTSGATQEEVDFVDVGIQLEVTPLIAGDSTVVMTVIAEISEVLDQEVQGIPRIGTREAHTRVAARSGETLVIGGLRKDQKVETVIGIPLLSRIPFVGRLFRHESVSTAQSEILIFLTPSILDYETTPVDFAGRLIREGDVDPTAGQSP